LTRSLPKHAPTDDFNYRFSYPGALSFFLWQNRNLNFLKKVGEFFIGKVYSDNIKQNSLEREATN
jgi:hypothetical protein